MNFLPEFSKDIYKLPNLTVVSNPGRVVVERTPDFPGLSVLLYHGYSFDYYVANVDSLRQQGGYDRCELIMQYLIKRRHLAPTYTSTLFVPDTYADPLVMQDVPDIFHTGHVHTSGMSTYRNVQLIGSSCWQGKTPFQERVGITPHPGRVPLVNLQTRQAKILRF